MCQQCDQNAVTVADTIGRKNELAKAAFEDLIGFARDVEGEQSGEGAQTILGKYMQLTSAIRRVLGGLRAGVAEDLIAYAAWQLAGMPDVQSEVARVAEEAGPQDLMAQLAAAFGSEGGMKVLTIDRSGKLVELTGPNGPVEATAPAIEATRQDDLPVGLYL